MPSIKGLWPDKWLKAHHLQNKSVLVTIEQVYVENLFNPLSRQEEPKLILQFFSKKLRMILNKTQAHGLAAIAGTDDFTQWLGHQVVISPGIAPNRQATIVFSAAPSAPPTVRFESQEEEEEQEQPPAQPEAQEPPEEPTI